MICVTAWILASCPGGFPSRYSRAAFFFGSIDVHGHIPTKVVTNDSKGCSFSTAIIVEIQTIWRASMNWGDTREKHSAHPVISRVRSTYLFRMIQWRSFGNFLSSTWTFQEGLSDPNLNVRNEHLKSPMSAHNTCSGWRLRLMILSILVCVCFQASLSDSDSITWHHLFRFYFANPVRLSDQEVFHEIKMLVAEELQGWDSDSLSDNSEGPWFKIMDRRHRAPAANSRDPDWIRKRCYRVALTREPDKCLGFAHVGLRTAQRCPRRLM